jgi:anti-sigma regulatory factor (Ser/Thr protein kinase)
MDVTLRSSLTQVLPIDDSSQIGYARRIAQTLAERCGFDATDAGRVALIVTELASNILKHAGRGELHLRVLPGGLQAGVEILAVDRGPGFDPHVCMADGFSSQGTQGIGLGAIFRQAQVFDVYSDAQGSVVLARCYSRTDKVQDLRFGVSQHSLRDDPACGDVWGLAIAGSRISALMIDGLGHGEEAEAAGLAGAAIFHQQPFTALHTLLDDMHLAMRGTRGGAVALSQFDASEGRLRFLGIGNIGASLIDVEKSRGLTSHPGIVGLQYRKPQAYEYSQSNGQLLVLYSDGLQSRWSLGGYHGLRYRHPAIIAALLHRDFCRGRDDVTVMAIALESAHV